MSPKVMSIVGARPQFVKAGPVSRALTEAGITEILVHTGQHYDNLMSEAIMRDVGLREPDHNIGVGSESHGAQTGRMLEGIERLIVDSRPDAVVVYGDTNSTVAGALASTKLGVFTAHVEAGLRSFNRSMPEELNRVATDHLSDLLFAPTTTAVEHLLNEGLAERTVLTGDVMVDALLSVDLDAVAMPDWARGDFYAATIHRPSNTDNADRLRRITDALGQLDLPVHLMAHPRLGARLDRAGPVPEDGLLVHEPLPFAQMLGVLKASKAVITDSGGLQKEAFILGVPCITLRSETEWPETLVGDWNVLAGETLDRLPSMVKRTPRSVRDQPFGDGRAASRIVEALADRLETG